VLCSFGFLDPTKLNHRLLECWFGSSLSKDAHCHLVFVGDNHWGEYGANLVQRITERGLDDRVRITGFASPELFRQYLTAADLAVQLRTHSRGETSAAVLDCMNHALPVIVNANGAMAELEREAVCMLSDEFDDEELVSALETLWQEPDKRHALGQRAQALIRDRNSPAKCASLYAEAIERVQRKTETSTPSLLHAIATHEAAAFNDPQLLTLCLSIAESLPLARPAKRLFLDVTTTSRNDLKTGIERVARALLLAMIEVPPPDYRIEPIYLDQVGGKWLYRHAHRYTLSLLECPVDALDDEVVDAKCGDTLLILDLSGYMLVQAKDSGLYSAYRDKGVAVYSVVFDLLPVQMPAVFPPGAAVSHRQWLESISTFDGAVCISRIVARDFAKWQTESRLRWTDRRPFNITWCHLGADVSNSSPSKGLPRDAVEVIQTLRARPTFLMVGTIEPRKGYLQAIAALTQLWECDVDVNLVIVGKEGWPGLPDDMRRDIPETVRILRNHPELKTRLFWLGDISDEYLEKIYADSACLIAASYGEGFGLPLIEAAQHKLPIIARDIPVFREVAGNHAYFFNSHSADALAQAIQHWLVLYGQSQHPKSDELPWLTWKDSAAQLLSFLCASSSRTLE
jgi:glycosyltransferase involved in cell wall biosynthesis